MGRMVDEPEIWYAAAHFKLGEAYRARGRWEKARSEYGKAIGISPQYYEAYKAIGETYLAQGRPHSAVEFLQRAAAIRNDDPQLHLDLGWVFLSKGNYADAASEFARALKGDPDNPRIHYFIGKMCLDKEEYQRAIFHLKKALPLKTLRLGAQVSIGMAQIGLGEFEEATIMLRDVLREDPANISALDGIIVAYRQRGMEYEAVKYFRRAVSIKARRGPAQGAPLGYSTSRARPAEESPPGSSRGPLRICSSSPKAGPTEKR